MCALLLCLIEPCFVQAQRGGGGGGGGRGRRHGVRGGGIDGIRFAPFHCFLS